ncbi:hypothetical protein ACY3TM_001792 [Campylobacter jejuni]
MNEKNVVLLGESHFAMENGIQKGLRDSGCHVFNLSLGATPGIQNLYEIIRNRQIIQKADLIITGSNTHDVAQYNNLNLIKLCYRNLNWLYKELYFLNKKIISFISPMPQNFLNPDCLNIVVNIHRFLSNYYGFNCIDMHEYYVKSNLYSFQILRDGAHDFDFIMQELGKNIVKNYTFLKKPKSLNILNDNPKFIIFTPEGNKSVLKNSCYNEQIYEMNHNAKIRLKADYTGYFPIAIHTWNYNTFDYGDIIISNNKNFISSNTNVSPYMFVKDLYNTNFQIQNNTFITVSNLKKNGKVNFISMLLASCKGNYYRKLSDSEIIKLKNKNITLEKKYCCDRLIPSIHFYKEIIDEYCSIMDPRKLAPLQNQIKEKDNIISTLNQEKTTLQNELNSIPIKKQNLEIKNLEQDLIIKKLESKKLAKSLGIKMSIINPKITFIQANSAKARIQNHLSYKLGQALIENSKSILGYIRMPYVLSYIKDKHKFEQKAYEEKIKENPNLALPPLETYPDYNEALKEKECFTYKLGEEFIKASKNWYGGGISNLYSKMCLG